MAPGRPKVRLAVIAVQIDRIGAGGVGIGRLADGLAVMVPRTAPGDLAEVELQERKRRYARGVVSRVATPGPGRVAPTCPHYQDDECGGCQLQHLDMSAQLEIKRALVGDALRRIGKRAVADPPIEPSDAAWRYRRRIALAVSGPPEHRTIGLHSYQSPDHVFALRDCPITRQSLMDLWAKLRERVQLFPADMTALLLREDRDGKCHVIVRADGHPWDARPLAQAVGQPDVVYWWEPAGGAARVLEGAAEPFPALAFEQVNPALAARARAAAATALGDVRGQVIWDLYGGVGDTARLLAERGASVWSVDADRRAVEWGSRQPVPESGRISWVTGRVENVLSRLPAPHGVVANPPRAGLDQRVAAALERWAGSHAGARFCYLSCDPATLARDVSRLPSLEVDQLTAWDLFPQTAHVESLAVLVAP